MILSVSEEMTEQGCGLHFYVVSDVVLYYTAKGKV